MNDLYEQAARWDQWAPYYDEDTRRQDPSRAAAGLAALARGGAALELGIGTGRVAFALAGHGVPVSGLDASPEMVRRLEERHSRMPADRAPVQAKIGDMARFDVGTPYRLIYITVSTLPAHQPGSPDRLFP